MKSSFTPQGPFNLLYQNQFFNGWPVLEDGQTVVMTFPVEGCTDSAAVTLKQKDGVLEIETYHTKYPEKAKEQALSAMSLDVDGSDWPNIGKKDGKVAELQESYQYMRPTLFHSPYEAAAAFIIGHRITIQQSRKIRSAISEEYGEGIELLDNTFHAFPQPNRLLKITEYKGLNDTKIDRLHAVARAAMDGWLEREYLRSLSIDDALAKLETIPGIGPFFSQGILFRGAGIANGLIHDDMTYHAIKTIYNLDKSPTQKQVEEISNNWVPFRSWVIVLMHVWLRETNNYPKRTFSKK